MTKLDREKQTIEAMVKIYCNGQHKTEEDLCEKCKGLLDYAFLRLDKCPFQENKPNCGDCKIHCYKPEMKELVRVVMKYAGPRMLTKHPALAMQHLINALKKEKKNVRNKAKH